MKKLRQLIAIALLAVFGLPLASSLFALTPKGEADLPVCCRRTGKHHCATAERSPRLDDKPRFAAEQEKCPFPQAQFVLSQQPNLFGMPAGQIPFFGLNRQAAIVVQTESKRRLFRDLSGQKRGPPCSTLL